MAEWEEKHEKQRMEAKRTAEAGAMRQGAKAQRKVEAEANCDMGCCSAATAVVGEPAVTVGAHCG